MTFSDWWKKQQNESIQPQPADYQMRQPSVEQAPNYDRLTRSERWVVNRLPGFAETNVGQALARFSEGWAGQLLQKLDWPAEQVERGAGLAAQLIHAYAGGPELDPEGAKEVINNINAAWYAGSLAADMANFTPRWNEQTQRLEFPSDLPGIDGLIEARQNIADRMLQGKSGDEALVEVRDEYYNSLGALQIRSQMQDTFLHVVGDPLNIILPILKPVERTAQFRQFLRQGVLSETVLEQTQTVARIENQIIDAERALNALDEVADADEVGRITQHIDTLKQSVDEQVELLKFAKDNELTPLQEKMVRAFRLMPDENTLAVEEASKLGRWSIRLNPFALTRGARAHELMNTVLQRLQTTIFQQGDPAEWTRAVQRAVDGMATGPLSQTLLTVEGRAVLASLEKANLEVQRAFKAFERLEQFEGPLIRNISTILDTSPDKIIRRLNNGEEVALATQYMQKLMAADDGGEILARVQSWFASKNIPFDENGMLDALNRLNVYDDFVAWDSTMFQFEMANRLIDGIQQVALARFGMESRGTILQIGDAMKAAESLAFLKMNPSYPMRNWFNNFFTTIARGTYGNPIQDMEALWRRIGFEPPRLRSGVGMAGEITITDKVERTLGAALEQGSVLMRDMSSPDGSALARFQRFFTRQKGLGFGHLAQRFERQASIRAYTAGFIRHYREMNKVGAKGGLTSLREFAPDLARSLGDDTVDAIHKSLESALSHVEIDDVLLKNNANLNMAMVLEEASNQSGLPIKNILNDDFTAHAEARLIDAMQEGEVAVRAEVSRLRELVQQQIDSHIDTVNHTILNQTAARVNAEGPGAMPVVFSGLMDDLYGAQSRHAMEMAKIGDELATLPSASRNAYWDNLFADNEKFYSRTWERMESYVDGAVKGLDDALDQMRLNGTLTDEMEDVIRTFQSDVTQNFEKWRSGWRNFFAYKKRQYQALRDVDADRFADRLRSIQIDLDSRYKRLMELESRYLDRMDRSVGSMLSGEQRRLFMHNRRKIAQLRQKSRAMVLEFHERVRGVPSHQRARLWQEEFWPRYNDNSRALQQAENAHKASLSGDPRAQNMMGLTSDEAGRIETVNRKVLNGDDLTDTEAEILRKVQSNIPDTPELKRLRSRWGEYSREAMAKRQTEIQAVSRHVDVLDFGVDNLGVGQSVVVKPSATLDDAISELDEVTTRLTTPDDPAVGNIGERVAQVRAIPPDDHLLKLAGSRGEYLLNNISRPAREAVEELAVKYQMEPVEYLESLVRGEVPGATPRVTHVEDRITQEISRLENRARRLQNIVADAPEELVQQTRQQRQAQQELSQIQESIKALQDEDLFPRPEVMQTVGDNKPVPNLPDAPAGKANVARNQIREFVGKSGQHRSQADPMLHQEIQDTVQILIDDVVEGHVERVTRPPTPEELARPGTYEDSLIREAVTTNRPWVLDLRNSGGGVGNDEIVYVLKKIADGEDIPSHVAVKGSGINREVIGEGRKLTSRSDVTNRTRKLNAIRSQLEDEVAEIMTDGRPALHHHGQVTDDVEPSPLAGYYSGSMTIDDIRNSSWYGDDVAEQLISELRRRGQWKETQRIEPGAVLDPELAVRTSEDMPEATRTLMMEWAEEAAPDEFKRIRDIDEELAAAETPDGAQAELPGLEKQPALEQERAVLEQKMLARMRAEYFNPSEALQLLTQGKIGREQFIRALYAHPGEVERLQSLAQWQLKEHGIETLTAYYAVPDIENASIPSFAMLHTDRTAVGAGRVVEVQLPAENILTHHGAHPNLTNEVLLNGAGVRGARITSIDGTPPTPAELQALRQSIPGISSEAGVFPAMADFHKIVPEELLLGKGIDELWFTRGAQAMDAIEEGALSVMRRPPVKMDGLAPEAQQQLRSYLDVIKQDQSRTMYGAMRMGEWHRDSALLNYSRRMNYNNWLGAVVPYEFWATNTMFRWALHSIDRPGMLTNFLRTKKFLTTAYRPENGFPSRLQGSVRVPMPFMPDWMGDDLFVDPLSTFLPFDQFARPIEQAAAQQKGDIGKAERVLEELLNDGQISEADYVNAIETHEGDVWERAISLGQMDDSENRHNPFDLFSMLLSPHAPIMWAHNISRGTPENIQPFLPITRSVKGMSALMGINAEQGGFNPEGGLRRALGLPEFDKWDDYRIDRMLSNMAATGEYSVEQVLRAMIHREGELFVEARRRAGIEYGWGSMGSLTGIPTKGYPVGEEHLRQLRDEYENAWRNYEAGQPNAMQQFYEQHPEYETRLALWDKPEERLRNFLVGELWDKWHDMPRVHRQEVQDHLGGLFQNAFLNKETRATDAIDLDTLQYWVSVMGSDTPGQLQLSQSMPPLELTDRDTAYRVQVFYEIRDRVFDYNRTIWPLQQDYYQLEEGSARRAFRREHPELERYWDWRRDFMKRNPSLAPFLSDNPENMPKYASEQELQQVRAAEPNYSPEEWRSFLGDNLYRLMLDDQPLPPSAQEAIADLGLSENQVRSQILQGQGQ